MHESDSKNQVTKHLSDNNSENNMRFFNSMTVRFLVVVVLLFLSMIPVAMLESLIDYKITEKQNIVDELSNQWGNEQTIVGPILSIPYVERISRIESQTDSSGVRRSVSKDIFNNKTLMLLPENLSINAKLNDKKLKNDNTQATVFQANVELSGNFNLESLPKASGYNTIEWDKAILSVGLSQNSSVEASTPLRWEGTSAVLKPGTQLIEHIKNGIHANLEDVANENTSPKFKLKLELKGKQHLSFAPLGELTSINISTDSLSAEVYGKISPSSKVSSAEGLEATWRVSNLSRNYPQQWLIEENDKTAKMFDFTELLSGIKFLPNSDNLTKVKGSLKYIGIILGIVFLSLFILEFKRSTRPKPNLSHYLVVSLPILLVPILLFTLNEIMSFIQAYQIGVGTSVILIVFYVLSSLKSFSRGFYIFLILTSLYAALFIIMEMPEYAFEASCAVGLWITTILMLVSWNTTE